MLAQLLLPLVPQPLHQLLQPRHPIVESPLIALARHPLQSAHQVAIGDQFVGEGGHQIVGIEWEKLLRPIPPAVDVAIDHRGPRFCGQCVGASVLSDRGF